MSGRSGDRREPGKSDQPESPEAPLDLDEAERWMNITAAFLTEYRLREALHKLGILQAVTVLEPADGLDRAVALGAQAFLETLRLDRLYWCVPDQPWAEGVIREWLAKGKGSAA